MTLKAVLACWSWASIVFRVRDGATDRNDRPNERMSTDTKEDETDALGWIANNHERVKSLAESDRETAAIARAVLDYLDSKDGDQFADFRERLVARSHARQAARRVRAVLGDDR